MNWLLSIVIIAPVAIYLSVLLVRGAEWVFVHWPDITKEERWLYQAKRILVIVVWLYVLSVLVGMSGYAMYSLAQVL